MAAPAPSSSRWTFDGDQVGGLPSGAGAFSGQWAVRAESDAPSRPNALCQTGNAEFPAVSLDTQAYTDLTLITRFKPISGKQDQAGGLIFRVQDKDIPQALAIGTLTIVAINWLYYRQRAARMLVGDPTCDCVPVRRIMVISGTAGLLMMAATFWRMQWLDHSVVNAAHMMSRPEYVEAWLAGVRNENAVYMGLSVVVGVAVLTLLPLPRARAARTVGLAR
jgi:hypothetical protein